MGEDSHREPSSRCTPSRTTRCGPRTSRANTELSPIAGFWQAIEHVAWRRYFQPPRTTSYGLDDFDYFPKGTTALVAPRQLLIDAFDAFVPTVSDWSKVNDDTAVLRWVAERTPINISPLYSCVYNSRTDLQPS